MSLPAIIHAVTRERAVIAGIAIAVAQAAVAGQITRATAVAVIGGIILRFLVTPANEVAVTRPQLDDLAAADHADHADPQAFHAG